MQNAASSRKPAVFIPSPGACPSEERPARRARAWVTISATLRAWVRRYRSRARLRRQLREMDAYLAEKDVGLPVGSLAEEAGKPFWRA